MRFRLLFLAAVLLVVQDGARAEELEVDYFRDIKPIFVEKCVACHGRLAQRAGLRLDAAPLILKGGSEGAVLIPGSSAESELFRRVQTIDADLRMPPPDEGEPLTPAQLAKLEAWIDQGALMPDESIPPDASRHWAYQAPRKKDMPSAAMNPIDAFLGESQAQQGLTPVAAAPKYIWLRRVTFDLIGLPPTPAELEAFLADESADAYEKVVDRLLARPQYGERWGRHWMDIWRYSDTPGQGRVGRDAQPYLWRWRDWIVDSLNADKGYDRMLLEMLAADEAAPGDESRLLGGGYLARNQFRSNRNLWLDMTVEHTMKAFVGVTLECCKCHDHKFDPFEQESYYQVRAIFEPHQIRAAPLPGKADAVPDGFLHAYDADLDAATYFFQRGDEKLPDKSREIQPGVPAALGGTAFKIEPVDLPVLAYYPYLQESAIQSRLAAARGAVDAAKASLRDDRRVTQLKLSAARAALAALEARIAADRGRYFPESGDFKTLAEQALRWERRHAVAEAELNYELAIHPDAEPREKAPTAKRKRRITPESAQKRLAEAQAALDRPGEYTPLGVELPRQSSGRRLAFARWLIAPDHPLTARVAVNHVWLRHFGTPLVDTVFDFGLRCPPPRHAELLDWLAVEFREQGWSMKQLHRLIVTSAAYRRSSSPTDAAAAASNLARDPDNHFYWRMNPRRMEAEVLRDSVLFAAGALDLRRGGPDLAHEQGESNKRRSLYFRHAYQSKMKFLEIFDGPSESECYRRSESVTPQQALALANSVLSVEQARQLAREIEQQCARLDGADTAFIAIAFQRLLSRPPAPEELEACLAFLAKQAELLARKDDLTPSPSSTSAAVPPAEAPASRAKENLVHVLINHNDFITIR